MKQLKALFSSKVAVFGILFVLIITVAVSFAYKKSRNAALPLNAAENTRPGDSVEQTRGVTESAGVDRPAAVRDDLAKAVLKVSNMSCSGCISTIKSSVAGFTGIAETLVDLSGGKVEIYFDDGKLQDVVPVAKAITDSGYPATVLRTLSEEAVKKERALLDDRSRFYVVSVGGWDIARSDFNIELNAAKRRYSKIYGQDLFAREEGKALLENLKAQVASKLIDEGVMMQEIVKAGFKVEKETVERQLQDFLKMKGKSPDEFKASLDRVGYDYEYFRKKFEIKILINHYINERILTDAASDFDRQNLFNAWFKNVKVLAEVVYYDRALEGLVQRLSASGGCSVSS